jgi:lysyl-tRNA synthetase class 2
MIELYQAYGDYESMMDLTEAIICNAIKVIDGELVRPWGEHKVDYTAPWPRAKYGDLFLKHTGVDMHDKAAVRELAIKKRLLHVDAAPAAPGAAPAAAPIEKEHDVLVNDLFEEYVEEHLTGPVFVIDYPAALCPLTKRKQGHPEIAERFELFIHGMELANAYTELNDPYLQEQLFQTQLAGMAEEDSMAKMDIDFVRALKVGMPPAGGLGIGIDRLIMLLTNSHSIRDVIYFPLLRHEKPTGNRPANPGKPDAVEGT